ncbi:hypothetical protein ARMSODRAFT_971915 [Armillaria solidipes]|uniref:Uncharacterized protein n=1 Tax=Armillaria solidipes TaxID=1076256 RepID=A0A2H3C576_9AGAR|nr:hypothetical protein ARMSODRAFT_971915 [Armillaria solidipes]
MSPLKVTEGNWYHADLHILSATLGTTLFWSSLLWYKPNQIINPQFFVFNVFSRSSNPPHSMTAPDITESPVLLMTSTKFVLNPYRTSRPRPEALLRWTLVLTAPVAVSVPSTSAFIATSMVNTRLARPAIALATVALKGDILDPSSMEDRTRYLTSSTGDDVIPDGLGRLAAWSFQLTAKEAKFRPSVGSLDGRCRHTATPLKSSATTWRIRPERSEGRAVTSKPNDREGQAAQHLTLCLEEYLQGLTRRSFCQEKWK